MKLPWCLIKSNSSCKHLPEKQLEVPPKYGLKASLFTTNMSGSKDSSIRSRTYVCYTYVGLFWSRLRSIINFYVGKTGPEFIDGLHKSLID
jgi:hypothetical protein